MRNILVTGGAGYIGSHVVKQLGQAGHSVVVIDNLGKGFREAVCYGQLVVGDTGDGDLISATLREHAIDAIMHFAAFTIVPESMEKPLLYYANNTCATQVLIQCAVECGVADFIFSSTAAVYGVPASGICSERSATAPINPYGRSKLFSEKILEDACRASSMNSVTLRYFNVAGSDPDGEIGQSTPAATLLIKVAAEAATGTREKVHIYGTDYPTRDGTGVRDFIHVCDLAAAHISALDYLQDGGASTVLNCGYGHGYSVREVIAAVERVTDATLPVEESPRRAGDPPELIASTEKIHSLLDWAPRHDDLDTIVDTSLRWERRLGELRADGKWLIDGAPRR